MATKITNSLNAPVVANLETLALNGVLLGNGTGKIKASATLANLGEVLCGSGSSNDPTVRTLADSSTVTIDLTTDSSKIKFNAIGGGTGFSWSDTTSTVTAVANKGYIAKIASDITLPATAQVGFEFKVACPTNNLVTIKQNANQKIIFGGVETTPGTDGYLASSAKGNTLDIMYVDTDIFMVMNSSGSVFTIN